MEIQYARHPEAPPGAPPEAARAGDLIFVGGQMAVHPTKGVPDETKPVPGYPWHGSGMERQLRYLYGNLSRTLEELGSSITQGMKINSFHLQPQEIDMALRVRREYFGEEAPPPSTLVLVPELPVRGATVALDMVTVATDAQLPREAVFSAVRGPAQNHIYSRPIFLQAVRGGGLIFTRGKAGATNEQGAVPEVFGHPDFPYRDNQIRFQTEFALSSLREVLADAGASLEHVVKAEVHLSDIRLLAGFDEVWRTFFPKEPPARLVVPTTLALPPMVVEVELVAVDPAGPYKKEIISTREAPTSLAHESQAVRAGPYLFISGQMATDYRQGVPPEARPDPNFPAYSSSIKRQVEYIYKNVEAVCRAAGTSPRDLLRRRAIHLDLRELVEAEEVWREKLGDRLPPTTTFRAEEPLAVPGCSVLYDLTVYIP